MPAEMLYIKEKGRYSNRLWKFTIYWSETNERM